MSETESDPFDASNSAYEPTSSDETSDPNVAGPSSKKLSPTKKLVSLTKRPMVPTSSDETDNDVLASLKKKYSSKKSTSLEKQKNKIPNFEIHLNHIILSVSIGLSIFMEFQILKDIHKDDIQMDVDIPVYGQPIPLKKAKYMDVMQLPTRFVPLDQMTFYNGLTSEALLATQELENVCGTEDVDQAYE
ncbi:hypothetical protein FQA39_LY12581 [Lamprigera yunnana]|nr:hypothetical protein FQA39_LY12581 [Lamprigera yunnana]